MLHSTTTRHRILLAGFLIFGCAVLTTAQPDEENRVGVGASIVPAKATPGAEVMLNLKLNLADGAHANSNEITDPNLIPTVFLPKQAAGLTWGQPKYPQPTHVNEWYSTDPLSVYEDGAEITVPLIVEKTATPGPLTVEGSLRIQVCDSEKCYPVRRVPVKASLLVVGEVPPTTNASASMPQEQKSDPANSIVKTHSTGKELPTKISGIDFAFVDFSGKERKLSEFRGKFVLLDFWATWCKPCLADIPKLKVLYEKYKANGFEIIGMDTETIGDEAEAPDPVFVKERFEQAKKIVSTRGVTWTQATNETAVPVAMKVFGVKALPTKILIDRDGKIIATIGEKDDLTGIVEKLVNPNKQ